MTLALAIGCPHTPPGLPVITAVYMQITSTLQPCVYLRSCSYLHACSCFTDHVKPCLFLCRRLHPDQRLPLDSEHALEHYRVDQREAIQSQHFQPRPQAHAILGSLMPCAPHLQEQRWVVRNDPIHSLTYAPPHPRFLIHCPRIHRPLVLMSLSYKQPSPRCHENTLVHIELNVRHCEEI